jgi:hypothetical protein
MIFVFSLIFFLIPICPINPPCTHYYIPSDHTNHQCYDPPYATTCRYLAENSRIIEQNLITITIFFYLSSIRSIKIPSDHTNHQCYDPPYATICRYLAKNSRIIEQNLNSRIIDQNLITITIFFLSQFHSQHKDL